MTLRDRAIRLFCAVRRDFVEADVRQSLAAEHRHITREIVRIERELRGLAEDCALAMLREMGIEEGDAAEQVRLARERTGEHSLLVAAVLRVGGEPCGG